MATDRVRARFFYIQTWPAGQDPWPGPGPLTKRVFFPGPRPTPTGPTGPVKGLSPICGSTKKKISDPNTITITTTKITYTDFRSTFSLSKSQSKHKFQIYDFHFSLSEIIYTNTNTNSHEWGELNPEKKKKNGDSARSATARTKRSWDLRETGTARTKLPPSLLKSVRTARTVLPSVENGSPTSLSDEFMMFITLYIRLVAVHVRSPTLRDEEMRGKEWES